MKNIWKVLLYYALIPFIASLLGLIFELGGLSEVNIYMIPICVGIAYLLLRNKIDVSFAAKVNGVLTLFLIVCFTIMMLWASGNIESILMSKFCWLILPFAPIMWIQIMMGRSVVLYVTALGSYFMAFMVSAYIGKSKRKKVDVLLVVAMACVITSYASYCNRPAAKYGGHGFDYMHGFSSTDFEDYMVYSKNSKLVTLDTKATLAIENVEDMPILDGAEACYPLYAAFAKATYKDIDTIEEKWLQESDAPYCNGKIVTFTNSVRGFERLLAGAEEAGKGDEGIDMFFGAKPSASQLQMAKDMRIELEITPIAREAFVFFVEEDNPVNDLTEEQLKAIYHGDITNWLALGGKNQDIVAFQRPKNSGSQTMMEYFMGDISLKEPQSFETADAMLGVIKEVAQYNNESGAIGYSFRYFVDALNQEKGVKMLSINGVTPSLENIESGTYPLVTNVCLITRKNDANPYIQKMTDFILSEDGQKIIRETGYAGIGN